MSTVLRQNFTAVGTQIASSANAEVTTASNEVIAIDKCLVFNTNSTIETIKGYIETSGGSPGANDQVFEVSVPGGEHEDIIAALNITLGNSQSLFFLTTTASKVNLHLSGRRIVG
ncbi:MAG: hypothetical protein IIB66_13195 [Proteobacteria bacterium]|nr:hypothetical protein [Pseudomonadota bacterium]